MTVAIGVLGPLRVTVGGAVVDPGGPARRAVLARLALGSGEVVATDRLLDDLAEGEPTRGALGVLQAHVSHLRRTLEPDRAPRTPARVLVSAPPGYALRLDPGALDAAHATDLVTRARDEPPAAAAATLRTALGLWRGPAYGEFTHLRWAQAEAARLDELLLTARERLAAAELALGAHLDVVPALEGHVREHPLREEGVRLLATALHRGGRTPEALDLLRRTRGRLRDELGLDPGPALVRLEATVLSGEPAPPPAPPRTPAPTAAPALPAPSEAPLGRDAESARLDAASARVAAGAVELVLVAGEAGSGKTTLVDALAGRCAGAGWAVARGRCPEVDGAPPAWPWTEILRALSAGDDDDGSPFARGRAVLDALERLGDTPVLVTLDDLHRADDETLRLLRMVATGAGARLLLVGTHRSEEDTAALQATWAALAAVVSDRLELGGLDAAAVGALRARHGLRADAAAAGAVADRTGGNPLFVREVARLASTSAPVGEGRTVPAGVRDVLRRRLRELPGRSRAVLAHVALLGRSADVDVVVAVHAAVDSTATEPEDEVLDGLESAVAAGVLVADDGARSVRFVHDLWREVVHDEVPRLRRARRHALVLTVLEGRTGQDDDVAARAHHALAAGDRVDARRALGHVLAAEEQARARGAFRTAVDLAVRARDLALSAGLPAADVVGLRCRHMTALALAGATVPALEERATAHAAAAALGDPALEALALGAPDAPLVWPERLSAGTVADAVERLLDPARPDGWTPGEPTRVRLLVALFLDVEFLDRPRADAAAREALERARRLGDTRLLALALNVAFFSCDPPERWGGMAAVGEEMLEVADAGGHADFRTQAHYIRFVAALTRGDTAAASDAVARAVRSATDGQLETTLGYAALHEATSTLLAGRLDEAERRYLDVTARMEQGGSPLVAQLREVALFTVRHARGDTSASVSALSGIDAVFRGYVTDYLARALLDAGREQDARSVWAERAPVPRDWNWLLTAVLRAEVAVRLGDLDTARGCRDELAPYAGRAARSVGGAFTLGPVDLTLAVLDRALGAPEDVRRGHLERAGALVGDAGPWRDQVVAELGLLAADARR